MNKLYKNFFSSFQKKISFSFVLLAAAFVVLTTAIAAVALVKVSHMQAGERLAFEQRQLSDTFQRVAANANACANSIVIQLNSDRRISLTQISQSQQAELVSTDYILGVTKNNLRLLSDIDSINVLLTNGFLYKAAVNKPVYFDDTEEPFYSAMLELPFTTKGCFLKLDGGDSLYYCKRLRDITTNLTVGMIYLEITPETLKSYCKTGSDSAVVLTDRNGGLLALTGNLEIQGQFDIPEEPAGRIKTNGSNWLYRTGPVDRTDWQVTCLQDEAVSMGQIHQAVLWLLLASLLLLGLMALLTLAIARKLSRPVRELSAHMVSSAGSLPLPLPTPNEDDEIATLYANFNSMLEQNRQLFADFKEEQKQKIHSELALVQSQIKPHFLYNTLDTIYCLAVMDRAKESCEVTKALADYYRLVLNSGEEKITIERELAALQRYLVIMQVRYRGLLEYTLDCDESVKNTVIPKLLLQPLVENAIYHGIKPKKQSGTLRVYAAPRDGGVELTVTDDGVGMTQERFEQALRGACRENEDEETFGMRNVARRVQLFYGGKSGLSLRCKDGLTTVAITIYPDEVRDV